MTNKTLSNSHHKDGYVIARGLFSPAEISRLWQKLGEDLYSMFSRSRRVADSVDLLLGETVYHTSTKIMMKEPLVGGAWEWHQDYGYWHNDNIMLYPKLVSCMVAINKATIENGCLQVLKGSHHIGRLNHTKTGDQKGAELQFVEEAMKHLELVNVELEPGDTLFFHCNLLHKSNQNCSSEPRWSMIMAYNAESNKPFKENEALYYPLDRVNDDAIMNWQELSKKD